MKTDKAPKTLGFSAAIARWIILRAQSRFKGAGGYSGEAFSKKGDARPFPQAEREASFAGDFFNFFPGFPVKDCLRDKDVLDFGCGYGGRTVEYKAMGARRVCGVEPFPHVIEKCQRYLESRGVQGVEFKVCGHQEIPYPDASFDVVLSYDVLEHVENPLASSREMHRVLRPGGMSFNIFPLYFGATAHHLDYIVTLPGLHWVFSARTLVEAVNSILAENPGYGTSQQPAPRLSFDGSREVLPSLNGLSGRHFDKLFEGFEVVRLIRHDLPYGGIKGLLFRTLKRLPVPLAVQDAFTFTTSCILRKL